MVEEEEQSNKALTLQLASLEKSVSSSTYTKAKKDPGDGVIKKAELRKKKNITTVKAATWSDGMATSLTAKQRWFQEGLLGDCSS